MDLLEMGNKKNLFHRSEQSLTDGLGEKKKIKETSAFFSFQKNIQSKDHLLGKWVPGE